MANLKNLKVSKVSFETIREQAAATSGGVAAITVQNATGTASAAPYLPRVISAGEIDLDAHCRTVAARSKNAFETERYHWNRLLELVAEVLTDGVHTSVEFGFWRFALEVAGSVPTANSPCTAENAVWIAVYPCAELQAAAASIETMPDLSRQPFELQEVFGHDHLPNSVQAGKESLVMGLRLSMGAAGEKAELAKGTSITQLTYVPKPNDLPTRMRLTVPASVPAGKKYQLRVTAKGKNGDVLTTVVKENIEVRAAATPVLPTLAKIVQEGRADNVVLFGRVSAARLIGTNLSNASKIVQKLYKEGVLADEGESTSKIVSKSDTEIALSGFDWQNQQCPDGDWYNADTRLEVTVGGTVLTLPFTFVEV